MKNDALSPMAGAARRATDTPPESSVKVLVVDDEPTSREAVRQAVAQLGYQCEAAASAEEAWERHQASPADIVVSDWSMSAMSGLDLLELIRDHEPGSGYTHFVFMTGLDDREHFLKAMGAGADDYLTKPIDLDKLEVRLLAARRLVGVRRRMTEANARLLHDSERSLALARSDKLTGLGNRMKMDEDLERVFAKAQRFGAKVSVALCDIDRFKAYNDHFGHLAGDEVLRKVARALSTTARSTDEVYRYGGEEMVALLPEQSLVDAGAAAERLRQAIEQLGLEHAPGVTPRVVTISIGVAALDPRRDQSVDDWLRRADAALYSAKRSGRNRVASSPTCSTEAPAPLEPMDLEPSSRRPPPLEQPRPYPVR